MQVDTPDYQRGVVSAQALLATVASGTRVVTVGVPPNCETLVIVAGFLPVAEFPTVTGVTTGVDYPVQGLRSWNGPVYPSMFAVDVSDVVDPQFEIIWGTAPTGTWYVYSDAGVHSVTDTSNNRDIRGSLFTVPLVPYGYPGSHPPWEMEVISFSVAASGTLLAAPGANVRYRIFGGSLSASTAGLLGSLYDEVAVASFVTVAGPGNTPICLPSQGYPITTNAAIGYVFLAGAGTLLGSLFYTIENV